MSVCQSFRSRNNYAGCDPDKNRKIQSIVVRNPNLRWPVALPDFLVGSKVLGGLAPRQIFNIDVGIGFDRASRDVR